MISDGVFSDFLCCNRWGFDRIGRVRQNRAFYRIARSIRFQAQREFSSEFEDVARLIAANLVLLVIRIIKTFWKWLIKSVNNSEILE